MSRSDIAISVRGLCKSYIISHGEEKHTTLAEKCMARLRDPLHRPRTETFQALTDVSFDIKKGEVVGIIGRNGAGKSTLLKILSRITEPSAGEIKLYGRVGSLLEVGTGFHPELTGRENIFLNGAILGMTKAEIRKQFDAIVDFSGIEKFLDTPVKRYSSGMYVRLAFAVAAHLNPEILIVDEVLSVGDAEFQKKCLGKMKQVADHGRTVLFVSHNLASVCQLCSRAILLQSGYILGDGSPLDRVREYRELGIRPSSCSQLHDFRMAGTPELYDRIVVNGSRLPGEIIVHTNDPIILELSVNCGGRHFESFRAGFHFCTEDEIRLLTCATPWSRLGFIELSGRALLSARLGRLPLVPGRYYLSVGAGNRGDRVDWLDRVAIITVLPARRTTGCAIPAYRDEGYLQLDCDWETSAVGLGTDEQFTGIAHAQDS